jgi:hypothetical protein
MDVFRQFIRLAHLNGRGQCDHSNTIIRLLIVQTDLALDRWIFESFANSVLEYVMSLNLAISGASIAIHCIAIIARLR